MSCARRIPSQLIARSTRWEESEPTSTSSPPFYLWLILVDFYIFINRALLIANKLGVLSFSSSLSAPLLVILPIATVDRRILKRKRSHKASRYYNMDRCYFRFWLQGGGVRDSNSWREKFPGSDSASLVYLRSSPPRLTRSLAELSRQPHFKTPFKLSICSPLSSGVHGCNLLTA